MLLRLGILTFLLVIGASSTAFAQMPRDSVILIGVQRLSHGEQIRVSARGEESIGRFP